MEQLNSNFRRGDNAESFGVTLLSTFNAVAPVPRTEDLGIDAYCSLLRKEGRCLHGEDTFAVQLKSKSEREVEYNPRQLGWFRRLDLPMFIGSVDLATTSMELYTTENAHACIQSWRSDERNGLVMSIDPPARIPLLGQPWGMEPKGEIDRCWLGPPILKWNHSALQDAGFVATAYEAVKPWLQTVRRARRIGLYGTHLEYRAGSDGKPVLASACSTYQPDADVLLLGDLEVLLWRLESMIIGASTSIRRPVAATRVIVNRLSRLKGVPALGLSLLTPPFFPGTNRKKDR